MEGEQVAERRRTRAVPRVGRPSRPIRLGRGASNIRRSPCSQRLVAKIARYPDRLPQLERLELEQHGFGCDACALELRSMGGAFAGLERTQRRSEIHERIYETVAERILLEREQS